MVDVNGSRSGLIYSAIQAFACKEGNLETWESP